MWRGGGGQKSLCLAPHSRVLLVSPVVVGGDDDGRSKYHISSNTQRRASLSTGLTYQAPQHKAMTPIPPAPGPAVLSPRSIRILLLFTIHSHVIGSSFLFLALVVVTITPDAVCDVCWGAKVFEDYHSSVQEMLEIHHADKQQPFKGQGST